MAGVAGIDPTNMTFAELCAMHFGKVMHDWDLHAEICATIAEPNRDHEKRRNPFTREIWHPCREEKQHHQKGALSRFFNAAAK